MEEVGGWGSKYEGFVCVGCQIMGVEKGKIIFGMEVFHKGLGLMMRCI